MKPATIQKALRQNPWKPFYLCVDNGTRVKVAHPECLIFNGRKTECIVAEGREDWHMLNLSHLSSLTYKEGLKARRKNGRS